MKVFCVVTLSLFAFNVLASTWNCDAINPAKPVNWPKDRVVVDFDSKINSIMLVQQIPNENGTFSEELEKIFSKIDEIRGGFKVAFCESDVVQVSETYGLVNISSNCLVEKTQDPLRFIADFRKDQDGYFLAQIQENGGNVISLPATIILIFSPRRDCLMESTKVASSSITRIFDFIEAPLETK